MQIGFDYKIAIRELSSHVSKRTLEQYENIPAFKTASKMAYTNDQEIADKAETLMANLAFHLSSIEPDPKLFFQANDIVPIPDIHGDFVHLITTLHRHGLLNDELNLEKDFSYVFLGDFYNRGKDADMVDYWLNKQIDHGITIYRIAGNHELFFLAKDLDGKLRFKLRDPRDGKEFPILANDIENDANNGYQITEGLLNSIKNGSLLAAYTSLDAGNNVPILFSHTFITTKDQERLGINKEEVAGFVQSANKRFKTLGADSYQRFIDSKNKGRYDWIEISEPLFSDPLFNIFYRDENKRSDVFFMRVTGLNKTKSLKIISKINDEIPSGVYQIVGHTRVPDFDLPEGHPVNKPLILPYEDGKAFVQFTDLGMGTYYDKDTFNRPEVCLKP